MKFDEICDFRDLIEYSHSLEKRLEKQQEDIKYLHKELVAYKTTLNNYVHKDKIREKIKEIEKWDKELGLNTFYTLTVLNELLKDD